MFDQHKPLIFEEQFEIQYISGFDNTTGQNPYSKTHFLQLKGEEINLKCFDIHRFFSSLIKAAAVVATTSIVQNIPMELRFFFEEKNRCSCWMNEKKIGCQMGFFNAMNFSSEFFFGHMQQHSDDSIMI